MLYWFVFERMLSVLPRGGWRQMAGLATSPRVANFEAQCKEMFRRCARPELTGCRRAGRPATGPPVP